MIKKPRIFIGSSVEGLEIANAIQENLEFESESTIWTQGVFNLSKIPIEDLIAELNKSQFAIFVFTPDDAISIRNNGYKTARDNVIFELGLFMGKLGRERTFVVKPREIEDFHIPTDLMGITLGSYNSKRMDGNILAALGPFCNQVKRSIKNYNEELLIGFENEPERIKQLLENKSEFWEFELIEHLVRYKMIPINHIYYNIEKGLSFESKKKTSKNEALDFLSLKLDEMMNLTELIGKNLIEEQQIALGEPGVPGNALLIKQTIDTLIHYCRQLLKIERDIQSISVDEIFDEVIDLYRGITKNIIDAINEYPEEIKLKCNWEYLKNNNNVLDVKLKIEEAENFKKLSDFFNKNLGRLID